MAKEERRRKSRFSEKPERSKSPPRKKSRFSDASRIARAPVSQAILNPTNAALVRAKLEQAQIKQQLKALESNLGDIESAKNFKPVRSVSANIRQADSIKVKQNPYLGHLRVDSNDKFQDIDSRLHTSNRELKGKNTFKFVEHGKFVKQGEVIRAREAQKAIEDELRTQGTSLNPEMHDDSGVNVEENMQIVPPKSNTEPTPVVEWWDAAFAPSELREATIFGKTKGLSYDELDIEVQTSCHLIEHPVAERTLYKNDDGCVLPMYYTKIERKKMRRRNRLEINRKRMDRVRMGLDAPPKPKVKMSNMHRVLTEEAILDPSKIEQTVRQEMKEREMNHHMRNQARKLTPEESRKKQIRKHKEDVTMGAHVGVFRVTSLENGKHRFKVEMNAKQHFMTGCVLLCAGTDVLVVVEGGRKGLLRYTKLMCRRIDWDGSRLGAAPEEEAFSEDEDENEKEENMDLSAYGRGAVDEKNVKCEMLWKGCVKKRNFQDFRFHECTNSPAARHFLETKGCENYWDMLLKGEAIDPRI